MAQLPRCKECGFLAILQLRPQRTLVEADDEIRKSCVVPDPDPTIHYAHWPLCFIRQENLKNEYEQLRNTTSGIGMPDRFRMVIEEPREKCIVCFVKWNQGFSPREHKEMVDSEVLRKESRDFQEKQASDARFHNRLSLGIAMCGVLIAAATAVFSAIKASQPIIIIQQPPTAIAPKSP